MKKKFSIIILCMLFGSIFRGQGQGVNFIEDKSWKDLLAMAGRENRLIFLDCYTTWCGPCKAMAKEVFPLPQVGAFMNDHFINTKFDMEKGEGIELNKKYKKFIPGYPTYLLINAKGEVVHQVAGYNAAEKFIAKIKDGMEERTWIAYSNKWNAGQRDWPFVQTYLSLLEDAFQSVEIRRVTSEVLPKLDMATISSDSAAYRVFRKYWSDAESPLLSSFLASPGVYRKFRDPERDVNEWGGRLYKRAVDACIKASIDSPAAYSIRKAQQLIDDLRKLHVSSRENMIALLMLSETVARDEGDRFVTINNAARDFGLLRYDQAFVSNAAKRLAERTKDETKLKQYLACMQPDTASRLSRADEIRNYAFVIDKLGDKEKAKRYYVLADQKEAEMKQQLQSLLEKK